METEGEVAMTFLLLNGNSPKKPSSILRQAHIQDHPSPWNPLASLLVGLPSLLSFVPIVFPLTLPSTTPKVVRHDSFISVINI